MSELPIIITRFASEVAPLGMHVAPRDGSMMMVLCDNVGNSKFTGTETAARQKFWTIGTYTDGWHVAGYSDDDHCFTSCQYRLLGWIPMPLTRKDYN